MVPWNYCCLGAYGVIIANNKAAMFPMKMIREGSFVERIMIPVVSIRQKDHSDISQVAAEKNI